MFKFFKRKKEKTKIPLDFSKIKFELNLKSICYYEKLVKDSFYNFKEENILYLIYSIFYINNPNFNISFEAFGFLMEREDISKFFFDAFTDCLLTLNQFINDSNDNIETTGDTQNKKYVTDYVSSLIINYNMDVNYVMYKMQLWELLPFFEAIDTKVKNDLLMDRFWAYLNICPHINTKKIKGPEQLVPFEWEKEIIKNRKEQELKNNMYAIKHTIGKSIFGDNE